MCVCVCVCVCARARWGREVGGLEECAFPSTLFSPKRFFPCQARAHLPKEKLAATEWRYPFRYIFNVSGILTHCFSCMFFVAMGSLTCRYAIELSFCPHPEEHTHTRTQARTYAHTTIHALNYQVIFSAFNNKANITISISNSGNLLFPKAFPAV